MLVDGFQLHHYEPVIGSSGGKYQVIDVITMSQHLVKTSSCSKSGTASPINWDLHFWDQCIFKVKVVNESKVSALIPQEQSNNILRFERCFHVMFIRNRHQNDR